MIPLFAHDIAERNRERDWLKGRMDAYQAAGGSIATLPYLAPRELTRAAEFNSSAPPVRGIAAESQAKKRAQAGLLPHGEEQCAAAQTELIQDATRA